MYDETAAYKAKIQPLIKEIEKEAYKHNIPFFWTFAVKDDDKHTTYQSGIYDDVAANLLLSQSYINKMACILRGFLVVPNNNFIEDDDLDQAITDIGSGEEL